MLNVGLTGGIGSGKSAVSTLLAGFGATIVDADKIAREVVEPGTPALAQIVEAFGPHILDSAGALDRPGLARQVFGDEDARQRLNAIVHPQVRARSAEIVAAADSDAVIVHDIPLLAEGSMAATFHLVLVVQTPLSVRLQRLAQSRGMSEAEVMARINSQASDQQRAAIADVIIENGGSREDLQRTVQHLWTVRLSSYAQNLHAHQPAEHGAALDDNGVLERARSRIESALGNNVDVRLDGSGIVAEGADLAAPLAAAGWFAVASTGEYRSADPAVSVALHTRTKPTR